MQIFTGGIARTRITVERNEGSGLTQMGYLESTNPHELTIAELAEIQSRPNPEKVLHHYRGELFNSDTHFCSLCDRPFKLRQFFKRFNENFVGFEQEVQEMAFKIGVTQAEFNTNRQTLDRDALEVNF